jgi:hypothetical protein
MQIAPTSFRILPLRGCSEVDFTGFPVEILKTSILATKMFPIHDGYIKSRMGMRGLFQDKNTFICTFCTSAIKIYPIALK